MVFLYKKKSLKDWEWERTETLLIPDSAILGLGSFLGIEGDLACVGDLDGVSIYHRPRDNLHRCQEKWVKLSKIKIKSPSGCLIAGNSIVPRSQANGLLHIYKYDQELFNLFPLQEPIISANVISAALS